MTRRTRFWLLWCCVFCAVAVAGWIWLDSIVSPYPDVAHPPAEANRVVHPAGFSIIKPGRTRATVETAASAGDDQILILPDGGRSRYGPVLRVRRLREPPTQM